MPDHVPRGRRYSEHEVSVILQKAAELQMRTHERADASGEGMSLAELESIATEAGMSVEHVRLAAMQLATRPERSVSRTLLGAPMRVTVERDVAGELPASALEQVTNVIRRRLGSGRAGQVSAVGRSLLWTQDTLSGSITISVSPERGRTVIQVNQHLADFATAMLTIAGTGGLLGGGASTIALGAVVVMTGPLALGVTAAAMGGSYLLGRRVFRWRTRTSERELHELAEEIAACVAEAVDAERRPE